MADVPISTALRSGSRPPAGRTLARHRHHALVHEPVLVPGRRSWQSVAPGLRLFRNFPSGDFAFLGSNEPEVGEFQSCSLFSPMGQFSDQAGAREVAFAALAALQAEPVAAAPAPSKEAFEDPKQAALERPMSKREFLGSVFRRS
jgi:[NiFe] hydrogenase assembly HybE family chaperone